MNRESIASSHVVLSRLSAPVQSHSLRTSSLLSSSKDETNRFSSHGISSIPSPKKQSPIKKINSETPLGPRKPSSVMYFHVCIIILGFLLIIVLLYQQVDIQVDRVILHWINALLIIQRQIVCLEHFTLKLPRVFRTLLEWIDFLNHQHHSAHSNHESRCLLFCKDSQCL